MNKKQIWKKIGWFFYALTPMLAYFAVSVIVAGIGGVLLGIVGVMLGIEDMMGFIMDNIMLLNAASQSVALVVFSLWYYFGCKRPSPKPSKAKEFFVLKNIGAVILVGIGIQFTISMILNMIEELQPNLLESYTKMMESAGITEITPFMVLSVVIFAPIVEEIVFRGLTFYIARRFTNRFWIANTFQAVTFGVMHMNLVQGVYAFLMGLVMGWVYMKFHSLYASIFLHFVINLAGALFMEPLYGLLPPSWMSLLLLFLIGLLLFIIGVKIIKENTKEE